MTACISTRLGCWGFCGENNQRQNEFQFNSRKGVVFGRCFDLQIHHSHSIPPTPTSILKRLSLEMACFLNQRLSCWPGWQVKGCGRLNQGQLANWSQWTCGNSMKFYQMQNLLTLPMMQKDLALHMLAHWLEKNDPNNRIHKNCLRKKRDIVLFETFWWLPTRSSQRQTEIKEKYYLVELMQNYRDNITDCGAILNEILCVGTAIKLKNTCRDSQNLQAYQAWNPMKCIQKLDYATDGAPSPQNTYLLVWVENRLTGNMFHGLAIILWCGSIWDIWVNCWSFSSRGAKMTIIWNTPSRSS